MDVEVTSLLPEKILVIRRELNCFMDIIYENLPLLCSGCGNIGHSIEHCKNR